MLMNIKGPVSMSHVLLTHGIDHFDVMVRKLIVGFIGIIKASKIT